MKPSILILHTSGTNRDGEAARACELAGGAPEIVHMNQLRRGERNFQSYDMLLLPGGFSYGDALGAGARQALDLHVFFQDELHEFVASGKRVLGICNGFQTLVKAGVLPGEEAKRRRGDEATIGDQTRSTQHATPNTQHEGDDSPPADPRLVASSHRRIATLTDNDSGRFECRWVYLAVEPGVQAGFLSQIDELIFCPVAHGEGNFQVADEAALAGLQDQNLVALRYVDAEGNRAGGVYPLNPNGSVADIAGICNQQGNVVGLMPHPEDHVLPIQNPLGQKGQLGLAIFEAMIKG
jgi:phosphoribosylformylglycinamidine synthase subunit PurQ / glutaminase